MNYLSLASPCRLPTCATPPRPRHSARTRSCAHAQRSWSHSRSNVSLRDLIIITRRHDDRRIQVIANGLPLWSGVQLAVDTTLMSALDARGPLRPRRRGPCSAAGAESDELNGFCTPPSCNLEGNHDEGAPRSTQELWVGALIVCAYDAEDGTNCIVLVPGPDSWLLRPPGPWQPRSCRCMSLPLHGTANVDGPLPDLSDVLASTG